MRRIKSGRKVKTRKVRVSRNINKINSLSNAGKHISGLKTEKEKQKARKFFITKFGWYN